MTEYDISFGKDENGDYFSIHLIVPELVNLDYRVYGSYKRSFRSNKISLFKDKLIDGHDGQLSFLSGGGDVFIKCHNHQLTLHCSHAGPCCDLPGGDLGVTKITIPAVKAVPLLDKFIDHLNELTSLV